VRICGTEDPEQWRSEGLISFAPQDLQLFPGSICENIGFGDERVDRGRAREAAEVAQLSLLLDRLPGGLDTRFDLAGEMLSGGELQRIAVARALYRRSPAILMDEPTSALDLASERALLRTLAEIRQACAILVVTHRETLMGEADQILRLQDGALRRTRA